jgi:hypothetical protein
MRNTKAMNVQRSNVARPCNHCSSGKAISVTYSESVFVALCACPILSSTASSALQYFSKLSHKGRNFTKQKTPSLNIKRILIFSKTVFQKDVSDMNINVSWSLYKPPVALVRF